MTALRVMILGGYGIFGGRIAQLLADDSRVTLLIAGRNLKRATAFCDTLPAKAHLHPVVADRNDAYAALATSRPDILIDASGPFQVYGAAPYGVVAACIALGIHYLDLADGSNFVADIARFDTAARDAGLYVLSGVSSFPVLTAAAVRHVAGDMVRIRTIYGGIAPSPFAGVGRNVIRAIASYAGRPVPMRRGGKTTHGIGLVEGMRATIAVPGLLPLRNRRFTLVDVPDLQLLPALWPELDEVWMGAGPVPELFQRMLSLLGWGVSRGLLPGLLPAAPLFQAVTNSLRWGEDRGGMFVTVTGETEAGERISRSWHLIAEGKDGPLIPSMAVAGIIRRILDGTPPAPGARAAVSELSLADYAKLFAGRQLFMGEWGSPREGLFPHILGAAWDALPEPLRRAHAGSVGLSGTATVDRGGGFLANVIAGLFGFPKAGQDVPAAVSIAVTPAGETWQRRIGGKTFRSHLSPGTGRWDRLLVEQFGPFRFGLALVWTDAKLHFIVRHWSIFGMPLPRVLAPVSVTHESAPTGRFMFDVDLRHPWLGRIVRYRGRLDVQLD